MEGVFGDIWLKMVMYSGGFCRICVCFVSVWDQGYIEGRFDSG